MSEEKGKGISWKSFIQSIIYVGLGAILAFGGNWYLEHRKEVKEKKEFENNFALAYSSVSNEIASNYTTLLYSFYQLDSISHSSDIIIYFTPIFYDQWESKKELFEDPRSGLSIDTKNQLQTIYRVFRKGEAVIEAYLEHIREINDFYVKRQNLKMQDIDIMVKQKHLINEITKNNLKRSLLDVHARLSQIAPEFEEIRHNFGLNEPTISLPSPEQGLDSIGGIVEENCAGQAEGAES